MVAALFFVAANGLAQTKAGVSFDQTITSVNTSAGRYDSSTNVLHTLSTGGNIRIEMSNTNMFARMGRLSPGAHGVILVRQGGAETVLLNPDTKEYLSIKPLDMMAGVKKMLEGMGGSITFDTSATHVSLDSVGPGPTIDGHPTVHYTLKAAVKMTIAMMGDAMTNEEASTTDIYSATDMSDFRDVANGWSQFMDATRSMGIGGELFAKMKETQSRIRGFPLRAIKHSTRSQRGQSQTVTETIESRNIKRVSLPDSLFAIPAGYKPITMPVFPGAGRENAP